MQCQCDCRLYQWIYIHIFRPCDHQILDIPGGNFKRKSKTEYNKFAEIKVNYVGFQVFIWEFQVY